MFAEEQDVFDGVGFARGDQALLEGVSIGVGDEAEVGDEEIRHCGYDLGAQRPSKLRRGR
jgi:hypothetical protein